MSNFGFVYKRDEVTGDLLLVSTYSNMYPTSEDIENVRRMLGVKSVNIVLREKLKNIELNPHKLGAFLCKEWHTYGTKYAVVTLEDNEIVYRVRFLNKVDMLSPEFASAVVYTDDSEFYDDMKMYLENFQDWGESEMTTTEYLEDEDTTGYLVAEELDSCPFADDEGYILEDDLNSRSFEVIGDPEDLYEEPETLEDDPTKYRGVPSFNLGETVKGMHNSLDHILNYMDKNLDDVK